MILDGHMHVEPELDVHGLIAAMDAAGVAQAVLIGSPQEPIGKINPLGPPILHACMRVAPLRMPVYRIARNTMHQHRHPDNSPVFQAARAHPGRFLPYAFVNPLLGQDAHDELDRCMERGARGLKLHLWFHRYRLPDALPILSRVADAGLPVLAHLGFGPAEDVEMVLDTLPNLKLILAHAGIPHFERLWRLPRVMFDVAATPALISRGTVKRMLAAVGPSRVVYGSDAPIGIRSRGGYRYNPPSLPSRCYGETLASIPD